MADIARYHLDDEEQAVIWHREVLRLSATEKASLQFCVDYFSAREDWVGLASVYEAALRTRRRGADELAMLIQIGMILWRKVADLDRAERYFLRIKQINQRHPLMLDFYADLYTQRSDYKRLIHVLTARQSTETDESKRVSLGIDMATIAEEKLGNQEKAIDLWKSVLRLSPNEDRALGAIKRLYVSTGKWNALLDQLKSSLRQVSPERVDISIGLLFEMVDIYRDHLHLPAKVASVYKQVLELDPTNQNALDALEEHHRTSGRWKDLINVLGSRAELLRGERDLDGFAVLSREWRAFGDNLIICRLPRH